MRVLIDAIGCGNGGIATYVDQLLAGWRAAYPHDEIHVLRADRDREFTSIDGLVVHSRAVRGPDVLVRPFVQTRSLRTLVRERHIDGVLSVRPAAPPRAVGAPLAVVVHDLRHELEPSQFPRSRRLIRHLSYRRAYRVADGFVCISERTRRDLLRLHPRLAHKPVAVVYHGADHVEGWSDGEAPRTAVAFGNHTNKNVDAVLAAWRILALDTFVKRTGLTLTVVGLPAGEREQILARLVDDPAEPYVQLLPYINDDELQRRMRRARLVVYPSSFEGFGLPVIEAMALGVPVVIGPEPAVVEIANGNAVVARDFSPAAIADAVRIAAESPRSLDPARQHAGTFTWARTATQTRDLLASLSAR